MKYDLRPLIAAIQTTVENHNLGRPGAYRRWNDPERDTGLNPYGCADAANLLYTILAFPGVPDERRAWVETLQSLQDPEGGLFHEATHHPIHTTAHCIAALELFDARPAHPLHDLTALREPPAMIEFLNSLDWSGKPWNESHRGAGLYAALVLAGEVGLEWQEQYFAWLWQEADPVTGFWRNGTVGNTPAAGTHSIFPHLAGSFHYLFNLQYARQPLRYPEKMVDTCLDIYHRRLFPLGDRISFAEIDWVYCLTRAVRQSCHRFGEAQRALEEFASHYIPYLLGLDYTNHPDFNDLHQLFGAACCLAELQQALPGKLRTEKPLRLVLDRRPFI